jgi:hypothetical protein
MAGFFSEAPRAGLLTFRRDFVGELNELILACYSWSS